MCILRYCAVVLSFFFFFKQKTGYEMRISDWSSDVCSSDLAFQRRDELLVPPPLALAVEQACEEFRGIAQLLGILANLVAGLVLDMGEIAPVPLHLASKPVERGDREVARSEEHTSELQSLLRISYAVFCLNKKKQHNTDTREI